MWPGKCRTKLISILKLKNSRAPFNENWKRCLQALVVGRNSFTFMPEYNIIVMSKDQSVEVINEVIAKIEKALVAGCEIGAGDRGTLASVLKANKVTKKTKFFDCQRDHSAKIVDHFVKTKGIPQSKFNMKAQASVFLLY
jgi:hypothetical protein